MLEYLLMVSSQVGTMFLMMAAGFALAKRRLLTQAAIPQMTNLLLTVVLPCMLVDSMQIERTPALLGSMGYTSLLVAGLYVLYCLLSIPLFRRQNSATGKALRFGTLYGNVGFMGLPLIQLVLGEQAMVYGVINLIVFNLFNWSQGVVLMGGRRQVSLKQAVLNPGILGTVVALVLFLCGITLPSMVGSAVSFLGSMNTPLAMVIIGAQMASADWRSVFRSPAILLACGLKLVAMPLLTALILYPLHPEPDLYCTLVLLAGVPTASITAMFAQRYGQDVSTSAQLVTVSTLLSILTLPCCGVLAALLSGAA
ncbi:AEC family transporter [Flavonifractor sp. An9]|uniref:AEC family transporter n=1 Tax=Flavonifractor sp. An9 TaxID=1965664 RepID=UPI000B39E9FC|nr:AEC family transporter [Flavonifractor sp. An9]OUN09443.1 transporter [Flavonifractor sp. An9]